MADTKEIENAIEYIGGLLIKGNFKNVKMEE